MIIFIHVSIISKKKTWLGEHVRGFLRKNPHLEPAIRTHCSNAINGNQKSIRSKDGIEVSISNGLCSLHCMKTHSANKDEAKIKGKLPDLFQFRSKALYFSA